MAAAVTNQPFAVYGDRSLVARWFLGASAGAAALVLVVTLILILSRAKHGWPEGALTSLIVLASALEIVGGAVFAVWLHRAYGNLRHFGVDTSYTPNMAVAFFFLPVVNLIVPYSILRETWRGSDPGAVRSVDRLPRRSIWIVSAWWILFVVHGVMSSVISVLLVRDGNAGVLHLTLIYSSLIAGAASFVGMDLIAVIDKRQAFRKRKFSEPRTPPPVREAPLPAARPKIDWKAAILPVVTAVEKEMLLVEEEPASTSPVPAAAPKPRSPAMPAPQRRLSVLLAVGAVLSFSQSLLSLIILLFVDARGATGKLAWTVALMPLPIPIILITAITGVFFCQWLVITDREVRTLRALSRSRHDVVPEFLRRAGNAAVIEELWEAITFNDANRSFGVVDRWSRMWRVTKWAALVSTAMLILLPGYVAGFIVAGTFAVLGLSGILARELITKMSAALTSRLAASVPSPVEQSASTSQ